MFNVCPGCGEYSDDKEIDEAACVATCSRCGHRHEFKRLTLFVITGASCTGKTTVGLNLPALLPECVPLESDILWRDEFNKPDNNYRDYRNLWLRMAKNINQSGRPVVLIGTSAPGQFEECNESRYFSAINYLAFVCEEQELKRRLTSRPAWRKSGTPEVIEAALSFNSWLIANARDNPQLELLDTTHISIQEATKASADWVKSGDAWRRPPR
jgi:hypothetical protein